MVVELALPVANWLNKTSKERAQDIASVALEWQGKANIYWTTPEQIVRLTDTNRTDNETYSSENTATFEIVQWFFSDAECLAWISALKKGFYKTTRLGLKKKYTDGGRKIRVLNVDVYLKIPPEECAKIYSDFVSEEVERDITPEDFRDRPVEFNLPEGKTFDDLIRKFTDKGLVELMAEKDKATKDAAEIEQENAEEIQSARTEYQQIFVGARIEDELIKRGHAIKESTGCPGVSNREARAMLEANVKAGIGEPEIKNPDRYGSYSKKDICKKCGEEKMVCPPPQGCGICRDCQILFDLGIYQ